MDIRYIRVLRRERNNFIVTNNFLIGTQATAESYKNWKIRADSTMITSDNALENNSSSNDS